MTHRTCGQESMPFLSFARSTEDTSSEALLTRHSVNISRFHTFQGYLCTKLEIEYVFWFNVRVHLAHILLSLLGHWSVSILPFPSSIHKCNFSLAVNLINPAGFLMPFNIYLVWQSLATKTGRAKMHTSSILLFLVRQL